MSKQYAKAAPIHSDPFEEATARDMELQPVRLTIKGLTQVGDGLFEVEGCEPRKIDWPAVREALGYEGDIPDRVADAIGEAVFREDVITFLTNNTTPA